MKDRRKNMDKKGKFVPEFNKKDPATRPKMDITNEAGYENPYVVDNILTGALTEGMKKKASKMSHFQRFAGLKKN